MGGFLLKRVKSYAVFFVVDFRVNDMCDYRTL